MKLIEHIRIEEQTKEEAKQETLNKVLELLTVLEKQAESQKNETWKKVSQRKAEGTLKPTVSSLELTASEESSFYYAIREVKNIINNLRGN